METGTIESIQVKELFGQFSYNLPDKGMLKNPTILYGDNGVGKSTILTLVFHLLSTARGRGHRTAISNTAFSSLVVKLKNEFVLSAKRPDGPNAEIIIFSVFKGDQPLVEWVNVRGGREQVYMHDEDDGDFVVKQLLRKGVNLPPGVVESLREKRKPTEGDGVARGLEPYLRVLKTCSPTIFLVSAERRLDSDAISDPSEEVDFFERRERRGDQMRNFVKESRQIALMQALKKASSWVHHVALRSATQGSMNVHSVYETVLGQLAVDYEAEANETQQSRIKLILKQINDIERKSKSYSAYEMAGEIDMSLFRKALSSGANQGRNISAKLVDPYVRSVLSRLEAIDPIYERLDRFRKLVNSFLAEKEVSFSMSSGFFIVNKSGDKLEVAQLSSGEQQLLLLFCYALTTQDQPSVFMVDEPEISLNIKWQRQLLAALNEITRGTETQFVFASHSFEIIAQHRSSVVKLG